MRKSLLLVSLVGALTVGCRALPSQRAFEFHGLTNARLFIEHPRDLTHGGSLVQGSGATFLSYLRMYFSSGYGAGVTVHTDAPPDVAPYTVDLDAAWGRAEASECEFLLVVTLGEMRDAAPMTFRSDFAALQEAVLYRVSDRKEMWRSFHYQVSKGNIGGYLPLVENLAKRVVVSLTRRT